MSYLIDSDVLIDALNGIRAANDFLTSLGRSGLSVSIVALGEIYEGAYAYPDPEQHLAGLRQFLSGYLVLALTDPIVARFARERAALRAQGLLIPDLDLLIAATALTHDLTLVTRNTRHFRRIPALRCDEP